MPTLGKKLQQQHQIWQQHVFAPLGSLQPPAPQCPDNGLLPAPFSNCGLPEAPATTLPYPGNMAYLGRSRAGQPQDLHRLLAPASGWRSSSISWAVRSNPAGPTNTYSDLAQEAALAVAHFGITDLANGNIVIAQPPNFSDPNAVSTGYCAFHDYTLQTATSARGSASR